MKTCCYKCEKRAVGCRAYCEGWERHEKEKAARYAENEIRFHNSGTSIGIAHAHSVNLKYAKQFGKRVMTF